jgi:gluconolactonase
MKSLKCAAITLMLVCFSTVACADAATATVATTSPVVEKIADGFVFPEGPVWHPDGYLLFSDESDAKIYRINPGHPAEIWFDKGFKTNGLIMSKDRKKIYACCYSHREMLEIDAHTKEFRVIAAGPPEKQLNNVNDVAVDEHGNIFFTDPKWGAKPGDIQGVYRVAADGKLQLSAELDQQPNGIVISPDGKWLYVDRSGASDIWRYSLKNGNIADGKSWVKLEPGAQPDGMTTDASGNLYVAQAGNGKICVLSPGGKTLQFVKVYDRMATNCEFQPGTRDKVLYVTGGGKEGSRIGAVYKITFP